MTPNYKLKRAQAAIIGTIILLTVFATAVSVIEYYTQVDQRVFQVQETALSQSHPKPQVIYSSSGPEVFSQTQDRVRYVIYPDGNVLNLSLPLDSTPVPVMGLLRGNSWALLVDQYGNFLNVSLTSLQGSRGLGWISSASFVAGDPGPVYPWQLGTIYNLNYLQPPQFPVVANVTALDHLESYFPVFPGGHTFLQGGKYPTGPLTTIVYNVSPDFSVSLEVPLYAVYYSQPSYNSGISGIVKASPSNAYTVYISPVFMIAYGTNNTLPLYTYGFLTLSDYLQSMTPYYYFDSAGGPGLYPEIPQHVLTLVLLTQFPNDSYLFSGIPSEYIIPSPFYISGGYEVNAPLDINGQEVFYWKGFTAPVYKGWNFNALTGVQAYLNQFPSNAPVPKATFLTGAEGYSIYSYVNLTLTFTDSGGRTYVSASIGNGSSTIPGEGVIDEYVLENTGSLTSPVNYYHYTGQTLPLSPTPLSPIGYYVNSGALAIPINSINTVSYAGIGPYQEFYRTFPYNGFSITGPLVVALSVNSSILYIGPPT